MLKSFNSLPWLAAIGGFVLVIVVALIVIFGGDFSATGNKDGGSITIKGTRKLPDKTKVDCLPEQDKSQLLNCNYQ